MTDKTETATVSHRLVNLRANSAGCSCGAMYVGEGSADLRAQHRAHKASPTTAKKAPAKATATKPAVKTRPRKAATKSTATK